MSATTTLAQLRDQGSLRDVDFAFADLIRRMSGGDDESLLLAAALASRVVGDGHICLDLRETAKRKVYPTLGTTEDGEAEKPAQADLPTFTAWRAALRRAKPCVGKPGERKPLILDDAGRLYLHRYWQYERFVATRLKEMAETPAESAFPADLGKRLAALFDTPSDKGGDRQRLAAFAALRNRFLVITGGPGTGKTRTVARILALLAASTPDGGPPPRVRLAAPTGKAAMRVMESIRAAHADPDLEGLPTGAVPGEAATLHRLLGVIPGSPWFRHNAENPIDADVVIVDEASMIDLPMMAKLLMALGPATRLVLLGDMNQLASVEPGYVLGDICRSADVNAFTPAFLKSYRKATGLQVEDRGLGRKADGPIADCLIELSYSWRFPADGPVGRVSRAIQEAVDEDGAEGAWQALREESGADDPLITWRASPARLTDRRGRPVAALREVVIDGYRDFLAAETPAAAFAALSRFRVLCALRRGPYGVGGVNRFIEDILAFKYDPKPDALRRLDPRGAFYDRRVVMVTRNDYSLGLFNGDIGVVLEDESGAGRKLVAFFESAAEDEADAFRRVPVNMLPEHETAFAMTIHKSQGSEFGALLILLPPRDTPLLTKELLYTAVTRVKPDPDRPATTGRVDLWCPEAVYKVAARRATARASGLREAMREA